MGVADGTSVSLNNLNEYDSARFRNQIKIGVNVNSVVPNSDYSSIAIGNNTKSNASIAIGFNSNVSPCVPDGIGIGNNCNVLYNSIAIGRDISDKTYDSVVIGRAIDVNRYSSAANNASKSIAIGDNITLNSNHVRSIAIGTNIASKGNNNIKLGNDLTDDNVQNSICIGMNNHIRVSNVIALGYDINDTRGLSIGKNISVRDNSIGIGTNVYTISYNCILIGQNVNVNSYANNAISIGANTFVGNDSGIAIGTAANSSNAHAISIGSYANALADNSIAIGPMASANSSGSIAIGRMASANYTYSTSIGYASRANVNGTAYGYSSNAGINAIAIGSFTDAGTNSVIIGDRSTSSAVTFNSVSIGHDAYGNFAVGYNARGNCSLGSNTSSSAVYSVAIGYNAVANNRSVLIGYNINSQENVVAIGCSPNQSISANSVVIGWNAQAPNISSGSYMYQSQAVVIGTEAKSVGYNSIAIGKNSSVGFNGQAHTISGNSIAIGLNANVIANDCIAIGGNVKIVTETASNSIAIGTGINTTVSDLIVLGKYNKQESGDVFEIGCGENNNASGRKNAFRVTSNGDVIASGDIQDGDGNSLKNLSSSIFSKTSELTNDAGFITNAVNDLVNYYLKSETYTKTEVDNITAAIKNSRFEVVSSLPTTDIATNVIYLVPKSTAGTNDIKDEYINLDGTSAGWEKIGSTDVDLTGYATTTALNTALADYTTTANLTTLLAGYVETTDLATVATTGAYSDLTGTPTIPTAVSDLTNDTGFITSTSVTDLTDTTISSPSDGQILTYDATSSKWVNGNASAAIDELGDIDDVDLTSLADGQIIKWDATNSKWINASLPTIPTAVSDLTNDSGFITSASVTGLIDTTITTPSDGDVLIYDATAGKWVNGQIPRPIYKTATLTAGSTTVTFTDMPTTGDNIIEFFNSNGINYISVAESGSSVTLTFEAQSSDISVYCRIESIS